MKIQEFIVFQSSITAEQVLLYLEWFEENKECTFEEAVSFLKGVKLEYFELLNVLALCTSRTQEGRLLMCKWMQEMPEVDYMYGFMGVIQMMLRSLEEKEF